jgi:hypothetical protein
MSLRLNDRGCSNEACLTATDLSYLGASISYLKMLVLTIRVAVPVPVRASAPWWCFRDSAAVDSLQTVSTSPIRLYYNQLHYSCLESLKSSNSRDYLRKRATFRLPYRNADEASEDEDQDR